MLKGLPVSLLNLEPPLDWDRGGGLGGGKRVVLSASFDSSVLASEL